MTQDEIIGLARQAGFFVNDNEAYSPSVQEDHELTPYLESFAKLVAGKERERMTVVSMNAAEKAVDVAIKLEREACAAICDELHKARVGKDNYFAFAANAIRELRAKQ